MRCVHLYLVSVSPCANAADLPARQRRHVEGTIRWQGHPQQERTGGHRHGRHLCQGAPRVRHPRARVVVLAANHEVGVLALFGRSLKVFNVVVAENSYPQGHLYCFFLSTRLQPSCKLHPHGSTAFGTKAEIRRVLDEFALRSYMRAAMWY